MPRYIDAAYAIYELEKVFPNDDYGKIIRCFSRTPTADVVEVKRGKWDYFGRCSMCGGYNNILVNNGTYPLKTNYCPNCGAKMEEE